VIISPNDTKQYRHITLRSGLDVLLVSDQNTDKCSAALAVNVGHFDDPLDCQGQAHLLEHMMFLGTKRFPQASEYHRFIKGHGGQHNAWTGSEHTNYFFAINNNHFEQALDRFSDFFINPLLDGDWIAKEINAIESEYQLKYRDENRRFLSVLKEIANPSHPFSKFSVGNNQTFGDVTGSTLEDRLSEFYRQHYCASKMKLVLLSNQTLDQLAILADTYFSAIESRGLTVGYPDVPLYRTDAKAIAIAIKPDRDIKKLHLNFMMPHHLINYHNKPLSYIGYLLGHEGAGSLLSHLKAQGLANNLSAGSGLHGYNYTEFSISVSLTTLGLANKDTVIALVFQQIALIKDQGVQAWRYLEKHSLVRTAFDFQEASNPSNLTSHLATNMFRYANKDIIFGDYSLESFEPDVINACLDLMVPSQMRLITICLDAITDQQSKWYDTPYKVSPISEASQQSWLTSLADTTFLSLPNVNPFVVERLSYRGSSTQQCVPNVLKEVPGFRLWHMAETQFKVPKGHIYTAIDSDAVGSDARSIALCRLYVELLHDNLAEITYAAELAGIYYDIYPHQSGLTLHVTGFTPKLFLYFDMLIDQIILRDFSQQRFDEIKHQLITNWENNNKAKPINRLFSQLSIALQPRQYNASSLKNALNEIDIEDFFQFTKDLFKNVHLESYVHGDWDSNEVEVFADSIYRQISSRAKPMAPSTKELVSLEGIGTKISTLDTEHSDRAIIVYYQGRNSTPTSTALFSLFNHLLSSFFFTKIRTEQQLGYLSGTNYMPVNRHPGVILYIQSPVAKPHLLLDAIDQVLVDFKQFVTDLNEQEFTHAVEGLYNQVASPDKTQQSAVQRFWIGIGNRDHSFVHRDKVMGAIEASDKASLLRFITGVILQPEPDRLVLTALNSDDNLAEQVIAGQKITNITDFKARAAKVVL